MLYVIFSKIVTFLISGNTFIQAEARVVILKLTSPFHPPSLVKRYTCKDRRYKPEVLPYRFEPELAPTETDDGVHAPTFSPYTEASPVNYVGNTDR